jgi:hypothetical protein
MGKKADRRAARMAAAQARSCAWIKRGMTDEATLAHLRKCDEFGLRAALVRASQDAARPMSPHHVHGLVVLGALATIAQERLRA